MVKLLNFKFKSALSAGTLFLLLIVLPGNAPAQEAKGFPDVMKRGSYRLPPGKAIGDLVISEGDVEISGTVHGSVFVVDGDVAIRDGGVVFGNVTVIDDDLRMASGSVIRGSVLIIGGRMKKAEGARVDGGIEEKKEELPHDSQDLMEDYVVFDRPTPKPLTPEQSLKILANTFRVWKGFTVASWTSLSLEGLTGIELSSAVAPGAMLGLWKRRDWELRVGVAQFENDEQAMRFWAKLYGKWSGEEISRSVHVSLCEGAHWYFRHEEKSAAIWIRNRYLVMVDVGHGQGKERTARWTEHLRDEALYWINRIWSEKIK